MILAEAPLLEDKHRHKGNIMKKEWSSSRITLLLYFIVLLLPFSFYFIYTSFQTMQKDTTIVRQSAWIPGAMQQLRIDSGQQQTEAIDKSFNQISLWTQQNNTSDLYIGKTTLVQDFKEVNACWNTYKKQGNIQCYDISNDFAIVIEKMVYLKQKKIINLFYMSLALGMILILLTIYLVRTYIHIQMKKHAIHDHETTLFNKKYFLAEFKSTFARAVRHEYALSLLEIKIAGFEKESKQYDKNTKLDTLKAFGSLIHSLVRDGDLPARYDDNHFLILLPYTDKENGLLFEKRIREAIMQDKCMISENIKLDFIVTEFDREETGEAFIQRTLAI